MNRDEERFRHETNLIQRNTSAQTKYYYPVDQSSGGTWFGFNNHGCVMALLNRYQDSGTHANKSRGLIIPHLLQFKTITEITTAVNNLTFKNFQPFDLIVSSSEAIHQFSWDGQQLSDIKVNQNQPFIITSTSVDRENIRNYRHVQFNLFIKDNTDKTAENVLNDFHLFQNKNDTSSSVFMSRENTHTKSISQVILNQQKSNYHYYNQQYLHNLNSESGPISCQSIELKLNC